MKIKLQIVIEGESQEKKVNDIIELDKNIDYGHNLGISILESKEILNKLQQEIISEQVLSYVSSERLCSECRKRRCIKDYSTIKYRTLFGIIDVASPRLYNCACSHRGSRSFSPIAKWLPEHSSPELQYIGTKWASHLSYGKTCSLLEDILPISVTASTIRNTLHKISQRQESELNGKPEMISGCMMEWEKLPKPDKPLTVGIDGGYVRSWNEKKKNFEVIVGKSFSSSRKSKRFALVQTHDDKPRRRLLHSLREQGMQENQQVTFLSDGADSVRELQQIMHPEAEHILDWFHVSMRIEVLRNYAKGMIKSDPKDGKEIFETLESIKWYLWHGNVRTALDYIEDCYMYCFDEEIKYKNIKKLEKHLEEFQIYIRNNRMLIPNYGERWRYGETISTAFVESTVNEVVTKRMVKKQQMQWSHYGAHCMLQTRTAALNGDLEKNFERWYPGTRISSDQICKKAA